MTPTCPTRPRGGLAVCLAALACLTAPASAWAGGFEFPENGTVALSRGGAFAALANDGMAMHFNPAGLAFQRGAKLTLGSNVVQENFTFTRRYNDGSLAAPAENDAGLFPAPHLFFTHDLGLRDWGFGLGVYGPSAMGRTKFPADGANRYMLVDAEILMGFISLAAAYAPTPELALGATLQWAWMPKAHFGLVTGTYFEKAAAAACDNPYKGSAEKDCDYDGNAFDALTSIDTSMTFAPAVRLGALWRPGPNWSLGLAGRVMPIELDSHGEVDVAVSPELDKMGTVTHPKNGVDLMLKLPWTAVAGVRYGGGADGEAWDIEVDATYEAWSAMDAYRLAFEGPITIKLDAAVDPNAPAAELPLSDVSLEKRYEDVLGLRAGGSYRVTSAWTVRAGGFYETAAAPPELTHLDFVAWERLGATAGVGWKIGNYEIAAGYAYIHLPTRDVSNSEVLQVQPLSPCQAPFTDPATCQVKIGKTVKSAAPPVVGNGIFDAALHIGSVSLIGHWGGEP